MDGNTMYALIVPGVFLLVGLLLVLAALIHRPVQATVTGFSWFRAIFFEHYVWVEESSLDGFPAGSRHQHSQLESYQSYEYERTETITTTQNGQTTTTTRPVYRHVTRWRWRYFYEIERWVRSRDLRAEGTDRASCHWPAYQLNQSTHERIEKTREKYVAFFQTAKGKQFKRELPEEAWMALDEQATYTLKVNFFGRVKHVLPAGQKAMTITQQLP
ncbi:MAG TPA: hypothetical protein VHD63_14710 [Ktedonobacteraceae bacterium]|nr:hypothetical protein [Ktedonobacteraceae bacterium]